MDYAKQLIAYYRVLPNNPLSSNAQCLYSYLLNYNNGLFWIKEFTVTNSIIMGFTSLSRMALDRARNELKTKGYIDYKKGTGNQAGTYSIVCFVTQDDTQTVIQDDTQFPKSKILSFKHVLQFELFSLYFFSHVLQSVWHLSIVFKLSLLTK